MVRLGIIMAVVAVAAVASYNFIPDGEGKVLERLNEKDIFPATISITYHDSLNVNVVSIGNPTKPVLLLIHGSPGDWSAWENIITNDSIRASFYILSIDRAGFGKTTVPALANLRSQADVIWRAMEQLHCLENIMLVGHSYGGAVVEQLLIDHPEVFNLAILAAPTLSPDLMAPRWYNKVARWKLVNSLLSKDMKSSNIEMMGLPESLSVNEEYLSSIQTPIIYIQGNKDVLVPYETVDYFKGHKPTGVTYIILEDMNHFIPWSDPDLITNAILGISTKY